MNEFQLYCLVMSRKYASSGDHTYAMNFCSSGHLTWIPTVVEETVQRPTSSTSVRPIKKFIEHENQKERPAKSVQQQLQVQITELDNSFDREERYVFSRLRSSDNKCLSVNLYTLLKKKIHLL